MKILRNGAWAEIELGSQARQQAQEARVQKIEARKKLEQDLEELQAEILNTIRITQRRKS